MAQILPFRKRPLRLVKPQKPNPVTSEVITLQATYRPLGEEPKRGQPHTKKPKNPS